MINEFVEYYNNERVHESLDNLILADGYHGRAWDIRCALINLSTADPFPNS